MAEASTTYALAEAGILTFSNLFEARIVGPKGSTSGTPKYDATIAIDPEGKDAEAIKALCVAAAKAKWPNRDIGADFKSGELNMPFAAGDKLADRAKKKAEHKGVKRDQEFHRGKLVITARSKHEPKLAEIAGGRLVELEGLQRTAAKSKFYSGVFVGAEFAFVAYDGVGDDNKDGVTAYLNSVVTLNKGERVMGGGRDLAEVYTGFIGIESNESALEGQPDVDLGV